MATSSTDAREMFFQEVDERRLFAVLHRPAAGTTRDRGIVVCTGLLDEQLALHRTAFDFADRAAAAGWPVLRFDPPGQGDSEGELADTPPDSMTRAALAMAKRLQAETGVSSIAFLGVRAGAVAAFEAAKRSEASCAVAWAPVLSFERYFRDLLRRQVIQTAMYGGEKRSAADLLATLEADAPNAGVDVGGYVLTGPVHAAFTATDPVRSALDAKCPVLSITAPKPDVGAPKALVEQLASGDASHRVLEAEVFWQFPKEGSRSTAPVAWFEATLNWLEELSASSPATAPGTAPASLGRERAIWLPGPNGAADSMAAIVHEPEGGSARATIVIVDSRVEYRVGPHRFYVRAARAWAEAGFRVVRVDHAGNGDSPGDQEYAHMDSFPVAPVVDALPGLPTALGVEPGPIVLAGLCMGARNALHIAAQADGVEHLLAFGMPWSDATPDVQREGEPAPAVGQAVARRAVGRYLEKITDVGAWKRLLTGQSDMHVIRRVIPAALGLDRRKLLREPLFRALDALLRRGGRVYWLFGTNDVFLPDFEEQYAYAGRKLGGETAARRLEYVPNANHTFSRFEWQTEAVARATAWLDERFPRGEGA